ncbi:hypothetical protein FCV25MIE_20494 [Fagus crenata]
MASQPDREPREEVERATDRSVWLQSRSSSPSPIEGSCSDAPLSHETQDLHCVVDAVFHEIYTGHREVLMDATMRAFDGNWLNSISCTLMDKFLEAPYGFRPSNC